MITLHGTTVLLLGSGELGKEVVIKFQRLGVRTVALRPCTRRLGVALATGADTQKARDRAARLLTSVRVQLD